jgi:hypothetical protein
MFGEKRKEKKKRGGIEGKGKEGKGREQYPFIY